MIGKKLKIIFFVIWEGEGYRLKYVFITYLCLPPYISNWIIRNRTYSPLDFELKIFYCSYCVCLGTESLYITKTRYELLKVKQTLSNLNSFLACWADYLQCLSFVSNYQLELLG